MKNVPMDPVNSAADIAPTKFFTSLMSMLGSIFSFLAAIDTLRSKIFLFLLFKMTNHWYFIVCIGTLTTKSGAKNCTVVQIGWCSKPFCQRKRDCGDEMKSTKHKIVEKYLEKVATCCLTATICVRMHNISTCRWCYRLLKIFTQNTHVDKIRPIFRGFFESRQISQQNRFR